MTANRHEMHCDREIDRQISSSQILGRVVAGGGWWWLGQGGHGLLVVSGWSQWPLARLYFTLGARDIYDGYNKISSTV